MTPLRSLSFVLISLLIAAAAGGGVFAQGEGPAIQAGPAAPEALPGTGFTYQAGLQEGGVPVNGNCDFEFRLYDALTLGTQVGGTQTLTNLPIEAGRFTTRLNTSAQFGPRAFDGSARWLDISVRCPTGVGVFTPLTPRQPLLPSPLAFALPGLRTEYSGLTTPNVIGGHISNTVGVGVVGATIGGGGSAADPQSVTGDYGTVGGGGGSVAFGSYSVVGGGDDNIAFGAYAAVLGGLLNSGYGDYATVGGGWDNTATAHYSAVGGGASNQATALYATIGGGENSSASNSYATVAGGHTNSASGYISTVGGGWLNTASGAYATVAGGFNNRATGDVSFAAGYTARAVHEGAFVWADASAGPISSTVENQFLVRASGGVTMYTDSGATTGVRVPPGGGSWTSVSDRNAKANFAPVNGVAVLDALMGIPIETWNYHTQVADIRHMGPMAQDFYAAFGLGETETGISTVDADGVALAAIQGLYTVVQAKETRIAALEAQVAALQTTVETSRRDVFTGAETSHRDVSTSGYGQLLLGLLLGAAIAGGGFALGRRRPG